MSARRRAPGQGRDSHIPPGMRAALRAALRGSGQVSPNPLVGAALEVPGRRREVGWHSRFGSPHAEAALLSRHAGAPLPPGATLFVTLEPCSHQGKTPPCVDAVIAARPAEVVVAALDPDPRVRGRGVKRIRAAGIPVALGVGEAEALYANLAFHLRHAKGRSLVRLKLGASLDARLAAESGASRWITGEPARRNVHRERAQSDAVLVSAATVLADDPELTVRHLSRPQPSRLVVDSSLRTPPRCALWRAWVRDDVAMTDGTRREGNFRHREGLDGWMRVPRLVLATRRGWSAERLEPYRQAGWEVWLLPGRRRTRGAVVTGAPSLEISLAGLLRRAAREGLHRILVEAGPRLSGALLEGDLVDEISLYQAPVVLGGSRSWPQGWAARSLGLGRSFEIRSVRRLGEDVWMRLVRKGRLEEVSGVVHRSR